MSELRVCMVALHRFVAELFGRQLESVPGVVVTVVDFDEIADSGLRVSDFDVVMIGGFLVREWFEALEADHVEFDTSTPCYLVTAVSTVADETWAHDLGFAGYVDLSEDTPTIIGRLRQPPSCDRTFTWDRSSVRAAIDTRELSVFDRIDDEIDRAILSLIAAGMTDRQIADRVFLSPQTVRNRVSRLLAATGLMNRTQLAVTFLTHQKSFHRTAAS